MDKFSELMQYSSILLKASATLRKISSLLREGQMEEAIELRNYYKGHIEPLVEGLSVGKKN